MTLRLGVIGLSPGNGHPFSWSAICNGYEPGPMASCGFPVIPDYLARQDWPAARLPGVEVTHVWTQDRDLSRHIAAAARIGTVVDTPEEMLGQIDALLLARDDARNHRRFAEPFLRAGLPVYIDKPLALSRAEAEDLFALEQREGQIFSCSALRFAAELRPDAATLASLGTLHLVTATTPKYWDTYAIHLIDPVLMLLGHDAAITRRFALPLADGGRMLGFHVDAGPEVVLTALGGATSGPLQIRLHGSEGWHEMTFRDSFAAFRAALAEFVAGIVDGSARTTRAFNRRAVEIVEMGRT